MNHDNIDPQEFLEFVHDIDISWLPKDEVLREELIKIKEKRLFLLTDLMLTLKMLQNNLVLMDYLMEPLI